MGDRNEFHFPSMIDQRLCPSTYNCPLRPLFKSYVKNVPHLVEAHRGFNYIIHND